MRIPTIAPATTAPTLDAVSSILIRQHRDDPRNRRIIAAYRAAHPLCQVCLAHGRTTPTAEIHHIDPVAEGGATADGNLLATCIPCHVNIDLIPKSEQLRFKTVGLDCPLPSNPSA